MNEIGSVKNFGYQPNYFNPKVSASVPQQNNNNLDAEVKELKKEHTKTRKALIGVSVASALVICGLLLRNHSLAKKAKVNTDAVKNKIKDTIQKLKDKTTNSNNTHPLFDDSFGKITKEDAIDMLGDLLVIFA